MKTSEISFRAHYYSTETQYTYSDWIECESIERFIELLTAQSFYLSDFEILAIEDENGNQIS